MDKYQESKNRYLKEKVEIIKVVVPKGKKEKIQDYAKNQVKAKSTSAYIVDLIQKDMGEDIDIDE
jgi:hypothetical protein